MTEATPAYDRVFEALFHYDSTICPACQAAASDFPVHFQPPFLLFQRLFDPLDGRFGLRFGAE